MDLEMASIVLQNEQRKIKSTELSKSSSLNYTKCCSSVKGMYSLKNPQTKQKIFL